MSKTLTSALIALLTGIAGSLLIVFVAMGFQAVANPTTDEVPKEIPYTGTLGFNGEPVTLTGEDALWFRFELMNGTTPESTVVYSEDVQTNVYAGEFTALLGPSGEANGATVNLQDVVATAEPLFVRVTILGLESNNALLTERYGVHNEDNPETTAADDAVLGNPQQLLMAPFALWASNAADFDVSGDLTVGQVLEVGDVSGGSGVEIGPSSGTATGDVTTYGTARVNGTSIRLNNKIAASATDSLLTLASGPFGSVKFWGDMEVDGGITHTGGGDLNVGGDLVLGLGQSGNHGFKFGDSEGANNGMRMIYSANSNAIRLQKTADETNLFTVTRGGNANFPNGVQVSGLRGDYDTFTAEGTELRMVTNDGGTNPFNFVGSGDVTFSGNVKVAGDVMDFEDTRVLEGPEKATNSSDFSDGTSGSNTQLISDRDGFCFLSEIKISRVSNDDESAGCELYHEGGFWKLRAWTTIDEISGAECVATCLTWEGT